MLSAASHEVHDIPGQSSIGSGKWLAKSLHKFLCLGRSACERQNYFVFASLKITKFAYTQG